MVSLRHRMERATCGRATRRDNQEVAVRRRWHADGGIFSQGIEQWLDQPLDSRSDLFSLGVVLYTMITGFRPFQGNSAKTVVFKVMNIDPVPVASFQSDIPPELNAIVARAIAKNPDERYPSGAALVQALQSFRQKEASLLL